MTHTRRGGQRHLVPLLAAVLLLLSGLAQAQTTDEAFTGWLGGLRDGSYADKEQIVEEMSAGTHPSTRQVLGALLDDRLFVRNSDQKVFVVVSADDSLAVFQLLDPLNLTAAGSGPRDDFTKVGTNNKLRRVLRMAVARFGLASPDVTVRRDAVKELLGSIDESTTALLEQRIGVEQDPAVRRDIETGLAMAALDGADKAARLKAIATLKTRLSTEARNRLAALLEKTDAGDFTEPDADIRTAAADAVKAIESSRWLYSLVETLFFGLSLGSVLVLVAIGLGITFGVMGVINMAHGELMMLGAYTTYVVQTLMPGHIGASIFVAIPAAFLVSGLTGIAIERTIIRFLYGRPLETLLATFGVSLMLQQGVRSIFSALNRSVVTPAWMSGTLQINSALSLTYNRLYIIAFTLMVFGLLLLVLKRTRLGLDIRAVSQNRTMARAMGIRSHWVDAMTFGLGSGIAGVAGVALSQLTNVGPNLGQSYIIDSFMAVVLGGVG